MIDYPEWYRIAQVKFQIRKYTYRRETMFMKAKFSMKAGMTTRMIKIHNVQHLDIWLKQLRVLYDRRDYNLYYSLAHYKDGIPNGSLNLADRDFGNWNEEHWKSMDGYDFLLDIDAGNHKEMDFAHVSATLIKKLFDRLEVPYHLRFSGMGFHFVIPYVYFSELELNFKPEADNNIYEFFMKIAMELHKRYSEMIDTGIYDSRRVIKIPYSLALFPYKNYVCFPFGYDAHFNNFNLDNARPYNLFHNISDEPEHLFNPNGNVFKLLKELKLMKDG
ncbi:hypothetical protein CMI37_37240 [Candidatus Pacearchaeota archaeon]|nr:hypothetical protein [Candidatus Pacearchaeota archaeon]|tara:strand:+ start:794 stop:1618 length:825 start_codon:yes stop_codon:yes gene_type:complete